MADMSDALVGALMNKDSDGLGSVGWIILLFIFLLAISGNGFLGGNAGNAATQAEIQAGLYNQTVDRNLSDIRDSICSSNAQMLNATNGVSRDVLENRFNTQLGFQNLGSQMAACCCDIKSSILEDGEKTRALITSNRIADLQDQLDTARASVTNFTQTQTILNSLGRYVPYYNCGCGCGCNFGNLN